MFFNDLLKKSKIFWKSIFASFSESEQISPFSSQNFAAKIIIDISRKQEKDVFDGTKTVVVLVKEILREAKKLVYSIIYLQIII